MILDVIKEALVIYMKLAKKATIFERLLKQIMLETQKEIFWIELQTIKVDCLRVSLEILWF
jgi:hypothetical protein